MREDYNVTIIESMKELSAKFDDNQIKQFMYHIVKAGLSSPNVDDRIKSELEKLISLANDFHRANECGIIEYKSP